MNKITETICQNCKTGIMLDDNEISQKKYICPECHKTNIVSKAKNGSLLSLIEEEIPFLAYHPRIVVAIEAILVFGAAYYGYETGNWMWGPIAGGIAYQLYKKYIKPYE